MGVLTTGFNAPGVDLIAMLRPTKSTGLYVQMAGRGTRLAPGKADCLVLDFAGNVARHGPIDAVKPKRPGTGEGEAPVKVCPDCQSILATAVRVCPDCGHAFPPPQVQVEAQASTLEILTTGKPQWLAVDEVSYRAHEKPGGRPTLQVDYQCGLVRHREWVCFEHTGYARQKAVAWWRQRARARCSAHRLGCARLVGRDRRPERDRRAAERPVHRDRQREVRPMPSGLCAVREPRGLGWFDVRFKISDPQRDRNRRWLCSRACQDICHRRRGMIDPTPNEVAAMSAGGEAGGAYLEALAKSDVATLSPAEWRQLIEIIVTGYCDTRRELAAKDRGRLNGMAAGVPF